MRYAWPRIGAPTGVAAKIGLLAAIAASIGLFPASAPATGAPRLNRPTCAFNLPLDSGDCARLLRSRARQTGRSWMSGQSSKTRAYASQPFAGVVSVASVGAKGFTPAGELVLSSGSVPLGLTTDASQNLYVAISSLTSGTQSVDVFPRGATKPSKVYTDGLSGPIDVAVDRHGTLYVANLAQPSGGGCGNLSGGGSVVEYAKGSMKPTAVIADFPGCPNGVGVDSNANLYLTYVYYPASGLVQSDVRKYAYPATKGSALNLNVPGGPFLYGVTVTTTGDLIVANTQDDDTLSQILTFAHGSKTPTSTIQYGGGGWGPEFFAVLGDQFFAPAYLSELPLANAMAEFAYPSGKERFVESPKLVAPGFFYGFAASQ
jgi:hypothetical protein